MIDLEKAGLIGQQTTESSTEQQMPQNEGDDIVNRIDQALAAFMFSIQQLEERIGRCEFYLSYLLHQDPKVAEKIKEISEIYSKESQTGLEAQTDDK